MSLLRRILRHEKRCHFPCPICGKQCEAVEDSKKGSAVINHPKPWCNGLKNGDLLAAYVHAAKPKPIYPPVKSIDGWKDEWN